MANHEPVLSEEDELDALARHYPGLVHQIRVEGLDSRLRRSNGLAIAHSRPGMCGNRLQLWLDGGDVLRLWLYWPMRCGSVAALRSIVWYEKVGWVADLRTATGESARIYAYRAQLEQRPLTDAY